MFLILDLPVTMGQDTPLYQEGSSCPLPGNELVKLLDYQCLDSTNGGLAVCGGYAGWVNESLPREEERCQTYCVR